MLASYQMQATVYSSNRYIIVFIIIHSLVPNRTLFGAKFENLVHTELYLNQVNFDRRELLNDHSHRKRICQIAIHQTMNLLYYINSVADNFYDVHDLNTPNVVQVIHFYSVLCFKECMPCIHIHS